MVWIPVKCTCTWVKLDVGDDRRYPDCTNVSISPRAYLLPVRGRTVLSLAPPCQINQHQQHIEDVLNYLKRYSSFEMKSHAFERMLKQDESYA